MHRKLACKVVLFQQQVLHIIHDDPFCQFLEGNKYWKCYSLLGKPKNKYKIISHGGNQSNAMLALAQLCYEKQWRFEYLCRQNTHVSGNFAKAMDLNMSVVQFESSLEYERAVQDARSVKDGNVVFVPQGVQHEMAKEGLQELAKHVTNIVHDVNDVILLPSGTGTTACYLAMYLPNPIVTVPVAKSVLQNDMELRNLHIVKSQRFDKFAYPYAEYLPVYLEMLPFIELDLVYAPKTLLLGVEYCKKNFPGAKMYFVHTGGTTGNGTMLERFEKL